MNNNLSISEQLMYITVRIECEHSNGEHSMGTGFFFRFLDDKETGAHVPVVITNKHVIEGAVRGRLIFCTLKEDGSPDDSCHYTTYIDGFECLWKKHPNNSVDLCAMSLELVLNVAALQKVRPFYITLNKDNLPTETFLNEITALEDIIMVGYPSGIWDEKNNKPIFRKGITATDMRYDYNGKKEFVIDAACFPGSSGSPVMVFNQGIYTDKYGNTHVGGGRAVLVGILYAGPQAIATGEIQTVVIPTAEKSIAVSHIPNNLGYVIKAERILELEKQFL